MSILTHDEAKRLSQSSTDPLEVIRNVEAAVIVKLAGMQNALKDEIRLVWQPKCDALRQQLEAAQADMLRTIKELQASLAWITEYIRAAPPELEEAKKWLLVMDNAAAGAAPVEPSQAQPPAPSDAAREYMTGYSDGREWAGATSQAQPSQAVELDYEKKLDIVSNWFSDEGMQSRAMQMLGDIEQAIAAAPIPQQPAPSVPEGWKQAVALAYGHLWHVNNEPMAPIPLRSSETAAYEARKQLRDLLTHEERGLAINRVQAMISAAPQPKETK